MDLKTISVKLRVIIYIAVFGLTAIITYITQIGLKSHKENEESSMGTALLPIAYMTTESGLKYNFLHGYTCEVDQTLIHEAITPISSDRKMNVKLNSYTSTIFGISYEIRSIDGLQLIERTSVSDYSNDNGNIDVNMKFKNLLDSNTEYMLKITVDTAENGKADYYTRIIIMDDANVDMKLTYVNNFSSYTIDKDAISNITAKLETNENGDNTNLGRVDIHSKRSQVGFGDLNPVLSSDRYITLNEIDGSVASVTIKYQVETDDDTGKYQYDVKEFYRISQPDETVTYVYSFDRWMEQEFDTAHAVSTTGELYLGISADEDIEKKASGSGKVTCFVRGDTLWKYSVVTREFTEIFSFKESEGDATRENFDNHKIKILKVENNGNIRFLVYGYMNRGQHEGKLGISVFEYDAVQNTTTEIAFVPRKDTYKSIESDINTLAYLNDSNILYLYSNGTINYMDCATKECMVVARNVIKSTCKMSEKEDVLMYQSGSKAYDCSEINVLHLETGEQVNIDAPEGGRIKALGFIDANMVYGIAQSDTIRVDEDGNSVFPMYVIRLMDSKHQVVKEHTLEGCYAADVDFGESKLTIHRVVLDENQNYIATSDDELLSNTHDTSARLKITTRTTDIRQREKYLSLVVSGNSSKSTTKGAKYVFSGDADVNLINTGEKQKFYYAYGYGELCNVTTDLAEALSSANDSGGVVVDSNAKIIWNRYKSKENTISISQSLVKQSGNTKVAATDLLIKLAGRTESSSKLYKKGVTTIQCLEKLFETVYNLTGSRIELVEYFIDKGYPIIAKTGPNTYEVVYGYSASNVTTIDFTTGTTKSYTLNDFDNVISAYGNVMITAQY